ncbi:hypothetical protein FHX75_111301 [Micromonospora palomenae]|uniref:Uncharacterized protein n=1 Tax=Micromonospora palomenae TaxID=1461247 RepID=A0A561WWB2_9ACTN|nr:hypothetical protein [Micromonospora palomenae]TWG28150.1 hypothetical protein FHX75_111301 [Micromonospora palomenae]
MSTSPRLQRRLSIDDKRWAQRANNLQFQELEHVRATAQQWRVGLGALTTLLSVSSVIAAPNLADQLTSGWRLLVGALAFAGLLVLLYGTSEAMRGAFGLPDSATAMTGERLRAWESAQARAGVRALRKARAGCLCGILLLIVAAVAGFAAASAAGGQLVEVQSSSATYCGRLRDGTAETVTVVARNGSVHTVALADLIAIKPASAC